MALINDYRVEWDGTNLSEWVVSFACPIPTESLPDDAMSITGRRTLAGLRGALTATVEFRDPYASSGVFATMFDDAWARDSHTLKWRRSTDAVSATNPEFEGDFYITDFPTGGRVGETDNVTVTLANSGELSYSTS